MSAHDLIEKVAQGFARMATLSRQAHSDAMAAIGPLTDLDTNNKGSVVAAINELAASNSSGGFAGEMILSKSGQYFSGYLECDGSTVDPALYPNLVPYLTAAEGAPVDAIDLGGNGQLIFPITVRWGGEDHTYYAFDKNKQGYIFKLRI